VNPEVSWCAGLANGTNGGSVNEPVRISAVQPVEQSSPPSLAPQPHDRRYRRVMGKHLVHAYRRAANLRKVRTRTATEAIVNGVIGPWPRRK
jgi:hypothetical protein